ncbi:MAG: ATP-binding cassette domain-containing protein [Pseudomonadota bacterium]
MTDVALAPPPHPRTFQLRPVQTAGTVTLGLIILAVAVGPFLLPFSATETVCDGFARPSTTHPLGCNDVGQDLLAGVLVGGRISLAVGLVTALVATAIATVIAIASAWRGGFGDMVAMRIVDAVMALPFLPLVIVLSAFFGASYGVQILILCMVLWTQPVRELRSQAQALRSADYVDASRAMGASTWHVCTRHILPELAPLIVPQFVRIANAAILTESSLSFLGLGDPLAKSWGTILFHANARTAFLTDAWLWWVMPPGLLIALSMVALALIGHGIGDRREDGTTMAIGREGSASARTTQAPLEASHLDVAYSGTSAVRSVSLAVARGTTTGLIGESGSGKSTLAMAMLRLMPPAARLRSGSVWLEDTDLYGLSAEEMRAVRGRRVGLVPQAAMTALNPVKTIGWQVAEAARVHGLDDPRARAKALLKEVSIPADRFGAFPHELSGGQRQRVAIAIALVAEPEVLLADEPTTGLDVLVQKAILDLLERLSRARGLTVLFVTHDLPLIARRATRLAILQNGVLVESGYPGTLSLAAKHPHTQALFQAVLPIDAPKVWQRASTETDTVLSAKEVSVTYGTGLSNRLRRAKPVQALQAVSLTVVAGEVVALVGGSGSGKTTLARAAMGLVAYEGEIRVGGQPPRPGGPAVMVFQDPYQSLRPAMGVGDVVAETLVVAGHADPMIEVRRALSDVRLPNDDVFLARRVGSLSGGQRQRVAVARALVANPRLLLADEPTSMLDQSLRGELLALLERLRAERGMGILFITHDLALARHFADRIAVMHHGAIIETGFADAVTANPTHPYTRQLLEAA